MSSDNIHIVVGYLNFSTVAAERDCTNPFSAGIVHPYFTQNLLNISVFLDAPIPFSIQNDDFVFQSRDLKL